MGDSLIGTGLSGLRAAQIGLATTGHNISNALTPGYSRQDLVQAANLPRFTGSGYIGQGTSVTTIRRNFDEVVESQLRHAQSQSSRYDTQFESIKRIDDLLADPKAGLSPVIDAFFGAVQDLATRPADGATRQSLISASQALVARFRDVDNQLAQARTEVNDRIRSSVELINGYSEQIGQLNQQIALASGNGSGDQVPNDLLDQRDAAMRELAKEVNISVTKRADGGIDVFSGRGQALVTGNRAYRLAASPGAFDSRDVELSLQTDSASVRIRATDFSGGNLAGYVAFRDESLTLTENSIGRLASALTQSFNRQHRLGLDRDGLAGGDFLGVSEPQALPSSRNSGSATLNVSIADIGQVTASNYELKFDGANYQLKRLTDGTTQSFASLPQTVDGLTIALGAGAPASADVFEIRPTRSAVSTMATLVTDPNKIAAGLTSAAGDNRNALALAQVQNLGLLDGGRTNLQGAYAQMVGQIGNRTLESKLASEANSNIYDATLQKQQSIAGVNLDEEAANLIRYQQAYQAASKVIGIAQTLFDEILRITR